METRTAANGKATATEGVVIKTNGPANGRADDGYAAVTYTDAPEQNRVARAWTALTERFTRKQLMAIAAGIVVVAIIAVWFVSSRVQNGTALALEPVGQQTLIQTVSASGTVNPQNTITVGSQVSGNIQHLYADFNSKVKKGQLLARIDPSTFIAQLSQAQAALAQAESQEAAQQGSANAAVASVTAANAGTAAQVATAKAADAAIATAQATVAKSRSALLLAQTNLKRDSALYTQGYISQSQVQTDQDALVQQQTALQSAIATLNSTRAQYVASNSQAAQGAAQAVVAQGQSTNAANLAQAQAAAVRLARAQVQQDQLQVNYTTITSPVDGTVVNRAVSVGQTVAAGFQTPTLFTIAQDLHKMEVDIAVGEPDIGAIKDGQKVTFTVLAYPNDTFNGIVKQVRDNPTTVSNVVTYTVVTLVDNSSGKLLPGMTATALIQVASAPNALVVPLAALQYHPSVTHQSAGPGFRGGGLMGGGRVIATAANASPWGQASGSSAAVTSGTDGTVYIQRPGTSGPNGLMQVPVKILLVNGTQAAVSALDGKSLAAGQLVVTGIAIPGMTPAGYSAIGRMGRMLR